MKKVVALLIISIFVTGFWVQTTADEAFKLDQILVGSSKKSNKLQLDELRHTVTPKDVGVTIYQRYKNIIEGQHTLSVQEIRPDGTKGDRFEKTYTVTSKEAEKGFLEWSWHYSFENDDLGDYPGKWRVLLYVDGIKKGETTFTVETSSDRQPDTSKSHLTYERDVFANEVDGYMWEKMSEAERKAFALGIAYLMSRYSSTTDTRKIKISEVPALSQAITYSYQESGNRDKAVLESAMGLLNGLGTGGIEEQTNQSKDPRIVTQYSGSGMKTTRPFTVDSSWEIQWKVSGMIFQVYLQSEDGQMVDILANQQGEGEGSSYSPKSGTYYLEINAVGDWEIKIVEVE